MSGPASADSLVGKSHQHSELRQNLRHSREACPRESGERESNCRPDVDPCPDRVGAGLTGRAIFIPPGEPQVVDALQAEGEGPESATCLLLAEGRWQMASFVKADGFFGVSRILRVILMQETMP